MIAGQSKLDDLAGLRNRISIGSEFFFNIELFTGVLVKCAAEHVFDIRKLKTGQLNIKVWYLTKILQQAGFSSLEILYPIPAYPKFRFMADLNSRAATNFMISRLRVHAGFNKSFYLFSRVASTLGILPWFAPGFSIIAYKD